MAAAPKLGLLATASLTAAPAVIKSHWLFSGHWAGALELGNPYTCQGRCDRNLGFQSSFCQFREFAPSVIALSVREFALWTTMGEWQCSCGGGFPAPLPWLRAAPTCRGLGLHSPSTGWDFTTPALIDSDWQLGTSHSQAGWDFTHSPSHAIDNEIGN